MHNSGVSGLMLGKIQKGLLFGIPREEHSWKSCPCERQSRSAHCLKTCSVSGDAVILGRMLWLNLQSPLCFLNHPLLAIQS